MAPGRGLRQDRPGGARLLHQGQQVYIEGSIRYDEWTDKDGNKRNITKIRVSGPGSRLVLLGGRGEGGGGGGARRAAAARPPSRRPPAEGGEEFQAPTTTSRSRDESTLPTSRSRPGVMATLLSLERYLPPYRYDQEVVTGWVREWLEDRAATRSRRRTRLLSVYASAGVKSRASVVPIEEVFHPGDFETQNDRYREVACRAGADAGPPRPRGVRLSAPARSTWW